MKNILIGIIVLGCLIVATAVRAWAESRATSVSIICSIGHMRNEQNAGEAEKIINSISHALKTMHMSYTPLLCFGVLVTLCGVVGLALNKRDKGVQPGQPG